MCSRVRVRTRKSPKRAPRSGPVGRDGPRRVDRPRGRIARRLRDSSLGRRGQPEARPTAGPGSASHGVERRERGLPLVRDGRKQAAEDVVRGPRERGHGAEVRGERDDACRRTPSSVLSKVRRTTRCRRAGSGRWTASGRRRRRASPASGTRRETSFSAASVAREVEEDLGLQRIGVLELVDEEVREARPRTRAARRGSRAAGPASRGGGPRT